MFGTLFNLIALRHACDVISLGSMRGANVRSLEPCLCDGAWLALPLGVGVYLAARMYTVFMGLPDNELYVPCWVCLTDHWGVLGFALELRFTCKGDPQPQKIF